MSAYTVPTVMIVDDEEKARESIRKVIQLAGPEVNIVAEAEGVEEALQKITKFHPKILLLDIHLKDGTGFELLKQLTPPHPAIIFVTAFEQHALRAFRFSAIDYLLKPIDPSGLREALEKAIRHLSAGTREEQVHALLSNYHHPGRETKKIVLKTTDQIYFVTVKEIVRLESDKNYTTFFMESGPTILVSKTLKDYDEMLGMYGFIRVHQSHLVNIDFIEKYDKRDGGCLVLRNKTQVPVSTRKKDELLKVLESF